MWLHDHDDKPALSDSAAAYMGACDTFRCGADAGVLTCLLTHAAVCRPTRGFGDGAMLPLARALVRVDHVVTLDLTGLKSASGANWRLLGEVLRQDASIRALKLRRCGLRGAEVDALCDCLGPRSAVEDLELSDNPLGHDAPGSYSTGRLACRALTRVLAQNTALTKLDVSRCLLPPEAVVALRAAAGAADVAFAASGNCPREELLNGITHGVGVIFAAIGSLMMMRRAHATLDLATVVGCGVFCMAMNILYVISTLFHSLHKFEKIWSIFGALDHAAIYVLIAGTYTPFCAISLRHSSTALAILVAEWAFTVNGVYLCIYTPLWSEAARKRVRAIELGLYVVMGWMITLVWDELVAELDPRGIRLLIAGGVIYTVGIVFFQTANTSETRYVLHAIWHLCVLAATICHFFAIFYYVLPLHVHTMPPSAQLAAAIGTAACQGGGSQGF